MATTGKSLKHTPNLSESTVQRTSEAAERRLQELLEQHQILGGPTPWSWHKDARGQTCAKVSNG